MEGEINFCHACVWDSQLSIGSSCSCNSSNQNSGRINNGCGFVWDGIAQVHGRSSVAKS